MISVYTRGAVRGRVWPSTLRRRTAKLLEALGQRDADIAIVLTDDAEIRELNAEWRQKDSATDVLSFAVQEATEIRLPPGMVPPLGDLVISLETAERQVSEGCLPRLWPALGCSSSAVGPSWTLLDEVTFLLLHGTLHLVGLDHIEPADAEVMFAREAELLPTLIGQKRTADAS